MGQYKYVARTLDNKKVKGEVIADSVSEVASELKKQQLVLVSAKEKKAALPNTFFTLSSRIKRDDIVTFIRQLAVMVNAGIGVDDAVDTLRRQVKAPMLKSILTKLYDDLLKGSLLSEAIAKYPKVFPAFFKNMIYVGEMSGNLDYVLNKVADYYERDMKIKRKAKGAMIYPSFLFLLIVVVFIFLTVFIIPEFEGMLSDMGSELPDITKAIVIMSDFMQSYYLHIIIIFASIIIGLFLFFKTKKGTYVKHMLVLKIPLLNQINHMVITARFSRGLGVLINSGMLVMDAIEVNASLMDNKYFEHKFSYAIDEVKRGKKIARSIANINFFPQMFIEMLLVGESTGSLDVVLEKTADFYDDEVEKTIKAATGVLEPLLIIIAAAVVLVVILAIFLPMMSISGSI